MCSSYRLPPGHVHRMDDNQLPNNVLYSELPNVPRPTGHPKPHFQGVCELVASRLRSNYGENVHPTGKSGSAQLKQKLTFQPS